MLDNQKAYLARMMLKIFINGNMRETIGATLTGVKDTVRLQFDKPVHIEDGEELRIEEVSNGDQ